MPRKRPEGQRTLEEEFRLAARLTRKRKRSVLIRLALQALIEREAARALAKMGGTQKGLKRPRRRRSGSAA
jgi:hypothetical protein